MIKELLIIIHNLEAIFQLLKNLIEKDIEAKNGSQETPLHYGSKCSQNDTDKDFVSEGENKNGKDKDGKRTI